MTIMHTLRVLIFLPSRMKGDKQSGANSRKLISPSLNVARSECARRWSASEPEKYEVKSICQ